MTPPLMDNSLVDNAARYVALNNEATKLYAAKDAATDPEERERLYAEATAVEREQIAVSEGIALTIGAYSNHPEEYPPALHGGVTEIGLIYGISRQRAQQLTQKPTFPAPVLEIAAGKAWDLHAVAGWMYER